MSRISAALRRAVHARAQRSCEYCLLPEIVAFTSHQVDHIIAQKHGGTTDSDNLALSCSLCNKYKGSDVASIDPETGQLTSLYHPRRERWSAHFQIKDAMIVPLTPPARATLRLLQINLIERLAERAHLIAAGLIRPPV